MGGFVTIAGIANSSVSEVEAAMRSYATRERRQFAPDRSRQSYPDGIVITPGESNHVSVTLPAAYEHGDEAAQFLSTALKSPVLLLHIHDGDLWMYWLFANGKEVDRFNPVPDYFPGKLSAKARKSCAGSAKTLAKHWPGIKPADVERYLVSWNLNAVQQAKAYVDDAYEYNDCRQMTDIMRRLGLIFPQDESARPIGKTYWFAPE